jgi:predicted ATP-dependent serine protease
MPVVVQMVVDYVQELKGTGEKLVLIVGKPGSGKSKVMRELATNRGWRYLDCRQLLTDELLELVPKARPKEAPVIMGKLIEAQKPEVVLLDSVQVLFTPMLQLEPLALLRQLSRKQVIVAAWPGSYEDGKLFYTEAGMAKPLSFPADDLKVVELTSGSGC